MYSREESRAREIRTLLPCVAREDGKLNTRSRRAMRSLLRLFLPLESSVRSRVRYPRKSLTNTKREVSTAVLMADTQTLEKLIAFLKADLLFACCWPLRPTATACQRIRNKIFRWLSVLHGMVMVVVMVHTIYSNRTNVLLVMKLCCELCTTVEVPLQIVCYAIQYDRLQVSEPACEQCRLVIIVSVGK